MSSSAYYNFTCPPTNIVRDEDSVTRTRPEMGRIEQRRRTTVSPDSLVTSSSDSSSSLGSQPNSFTPNISTRSHFTAYSTSSHLSSSSSTSSTSSRMTTTNSTIQPPTLGASPLAKSPISPPIPNVKSQMIHSYTLNSLEPKPLRPFKSRSAYIDAMKEDLAEWLNSIYSDLELTPENFFSQLETGSIICRHANNVTQMGRNLMMEQATVSSDAGSGSDNENNSMNRIPSLTSHNYDHQLNQSSPSPDNGIDDSERESSGPNKKTTRSVSHFIRRHWNSTTDSSTSSISTTTTNSSHCEPRQRLSLSGPTSTPMLNSSRSASDRDVDWFRAKILPYKTEARPGTFFARDNICQFILWCRSLRIHECLLFETDDLVSRKNEKSFILCLLEVARIGFKVGMPTPLIIQLEQEIDREIENDAKLQKQLETEQANHDEEYLLDRFHCGKDHLEASSSDEKTHADEGLDGLEQQPVEVNNNDNHDEAQRRAAPSKATNEQQATADEMQDGEESEFNEDFGPKPQLVLNDLLNLHERVEDHFFIAELGCSDQLSYSTPAKGVFVAVEPFAPAKLILTGENFASDLVVQLLCQCTCPTQFPMMRIGDGKYKVGDKLIIFVRILRRHIMVRVGGGWQELSEFLRQKDPCRTKQSHHNLFNHHPQHQTLTDRVPAQATCHIPVSRTRLLGSNQQLNRGYLGRGPGSKSIAASMNRL